MCLKKKGTNEVANGGESFVVHVIQLWVWIISVIAVCFRLNLHLLYYLYIFEIRLSVVCSKWNDNRFAYSAKTRNLSWSIKKEKLCLIVDRNNIKCKHD